VRAFPTPEEATFHFAQVFQNTAACICSVPFNYPAAKPLDATQALVLGGGDEVPIGDGLYLTAGHYYTVTEAERGEFAIRTGGYFYGVASDEEGGELVCWHWHQGMTSWCQWPHLHARTPRHGDHIPTARVAFEQVVRWLIVEADLPALRHDWAEVLDANEEDWRSRRSWS